jgi:hypothetical protein
LSNTAPKAFGMLAYKHRTDTGRNRYLFEITYIN